MGKTMSNSLYLQSILVLGQQMKTRKYFITILDKMIGAMLPYKDAGIILYQSDYGI